MKYLLTVITNVFKKRYFSIILLEAILEKYMFNLIAKLLENLFLTAQII
jgi:hypothetical protein